jgi:hypothetical protein
VIFIRAPGFSGYCGLRQPFARAAGFCRFLRPQPFRQAFVIPPIAAAGLDLRCCRRVLSLCCCRRGRRRHERRHRLLRGPAGATVSGDAVGAVRNKSLAPRTVGSLRAPPARSAVGARTALWRRGRAGEQRSAAPMMTRRRREQAVDGAAHRECGSIDRGLEGCYCYFEKTAAFRKGWLCELRAASWAREA